MKTAVKQINRLRTTQNKEGKHTSITRRWWRDINQHRHVFNTENQQHILEGHARKQNQEFTRKKKRIPTRMRTKAKTTWGRLRSNHKIN